MDEAAKQRLRALPQVQRLLETPAAQALVAAASRPAVVVALRTVLDDARTALHQGRPAPGTAELLHRAEAVLHAGRAPALRRVINATGVVLHTNLGRAPLAPEAVAVVVEAARGYSTLELDLASGGRGSRTGGIEALLCSLTGAEAAVAVNNNAAAMLLALAALAGSGEVIVSRGELVEIGGGFRIPDVIRQGGARLVEVGTTNKTRLSDYADAVTPATRVLLKVHQSNFRITGFTEATPLDQLAGLAAGRGLLLVHDLGSGAVTPLPAMAEATVQESVAAGVDVVAFSGDKLFGGPQSGLLAGRAAAIGPLRRHPLLRALRLGKLSLAALEATLRLHRDGTAVPVLRMMGQDRATLQGRAARLAATLGPFARPEATEGFAGGGTLPGMPIPSAGVGLHRPGPDALLAALRAQPVPVIGRIAGGHVVLDMLTVGDADLPELAAAVQGAVGL